MKSRTLGALLSVAIVAGCSRPGDATIALTMPTSTGSLTSKSTQVKDPSATWGIPLDDGSLAVRSDRQFGDGTYSLYTNGVCGVTTTIFATTASSPTPSGDAVLETSYPKGKSCGRTVTMVYPDGGQETLATFSNLNQLQSPEASTIIPVGQTSLRRLIIGFNATLLSNPTSGRCGRVIFGDNGQVGAGSDKLLVTRLSPTTWHVQSQPAPNNRAYCENLNTIYDNMNVDLMIVSSYPLPS